MGTAVEPLLTADVAELVAKPIILPTFAGWHIDHAIAKAIETAREKRCPVTFDFNGVEVTVEGASSPGLIYRDWSRALSGFVPNNKVGPHPGELRAEVLANDARIQAETEKARAERDAEQARQAVIDEAEVATALANAPAFALTDPDAWESGLANNQDGYGRAIYDFAETWARLMQAEIDAGRTVTDVADACCSLADKRFGISGFMYGAAVSILAHVWVHGPDLKRWHNGNYGRSDSEGTVNPAILTLTEDDATAAPPLPYGGHAHG